MPLTVEIEREGHAETVDVDVGSLTDAETVKVVALCGYEQFYDLSEGNWNEEAANAILYVRLFAPDDKPLDDEDIPPPDAVRLDWSQVGLAAPDPEMEAGLAELSEGSV